LQNFVANKISRKDVIWNYLATFLQIGSGVLLFPVILRLLSSETVGVWSIFVTITSLIGLLDFGFSPSFTRNITYIISGVSKLEKTGISNDSLNGQINYELLGCTIKAMKWFYSRIAFIAFFLLITAGSVYIYYVIKNNFEGDILQIAIAWVLFCLVNTYNIYTLYYDSLMMGCGLVLKSKQLIIISQIAYLFVSIVLIYCGFGIISIVIAQAVMIIIKRTLSYKYFFTLELNKELNKVSNEKFREVLSIITPNSIKLGLTSLGAFLVLQSSVIIGSFYLTLDQLASYGITVQVVNVIASLASVYFTSYIPKIAYLRVNKDIKHIRYIYLKCVIIMIITFIVSAFALILFGNWALNLLKSQTLLLQNSMILVIILITFLEKNHAIAGGFLLLKNEVPYFKAAIISGVATVIVMFILIKLFDFGIWGMILAPGIVQATYQNWKWPFVLIKELKSNGKNL
jgi:O-antigen/teichoic acid export membrane protein